MSKNNPNLFSGREAAEFLGVGETTLRRWRSNRMFEPNVIDHNGKALYTREQLEQLKSVLRKNWTDGGYSDVAHEWRTGGADKEQDVPETRRSDDDGKLSENCSSEVQSAYTYTTLSHIPTPDEFLAEAEAVLADVDAEIEKRNKKIIDYETAVRKRQEQFNKQMKNIDTTNIHWPIPIKRVVLPDGYSIDAKYKSTECPKKKYFNCIMLVTKHIKNNDTAEEKVEIAVLGPHSDNWSFITTEIGNISSKTKITNLSSYGLEITSDNAAAAVKYLYDFRSLNAELIENIETVNSTGWRNDKVFVFPNTPDSAYQLDDSIRPQLDRIFTSGGDKILYLNTLRRIKQNDTANVVLGAALSAPLVKHFRCPNIAIHVCANTGSCKSTLNKAVFALYGDPGAPNAIPTANATKVGLEFFFAGRHDLPAIIEDIDSVSDDRSKRVMRDLPYQYVNRTGRLRGKPKGGNDKLLEFRGTLITNGERPLTSDTSSGGGKRRLIELKAEDKIFSDKFAREITFAVEDNYGLLGREWVQFITEHIEKLKDLFKTMTRGKDGIPSMFQAFKGKVPLHINSMAAIQVANIFFDIHFLGMSKADAFVFEGDCVERIMATLPDEVEIADYIRAKAYISDWIDSHPKNFMQPVPVEGGRVIDAQAEGYETYGVIKNDFVAIFPTHFKKFLSDNGFNADMVTEQLAKDGFIISDNSRNTKVIKMNGKTARMIVISREELEKL